jgi:hypothetical protein
MLLKIINRVLIILFIVTGCNNANADYAQVTKYSFIGKQTNIKDVTMRPGEEATLTWTFNVPVKPFTIFVVDGDLISQPTATDETNMTWAAKVKGLVWREFAVVPSFYIDPISTDYIKSYSDDYIVPYALWYVGNNPLYNYVSPSPIDGAAAWVRVDRYPSYARWADNYKSISFDPPTASLNSLALFASTASMLPSNTPAPVYAFSIGAYSIQVLPAMLNSGAGQVPAPFQAALDGNLFTLVPSLNTGGEVPKFMVQVYDAAGIPVTGVIDLIAGDPSAIQSAFTLDVVQNPVSGVQVKGYNFSAGTNIDVTNGAIPTSQLVTGEVFMDQDQTFGPVPDIIEISPVNGGVEGGTTVTITGANLTDVTQVKFGQTNAASFTINAGNVPQTITAISPPMSAGSVDVSVASSIATDYLRGAYTYLATPVLSVTNSTVTYTGNPIAAIVNCSSGGAVTNVKYDSSATIPTNAGTYAVTADCEATGNYLALTAASAGGFVIGPAPQTGFALILSATSVSSGSSVNLSSTGGEGDGDVTYMAVPQSPQTTEFAGNVGAATSGLQCNISGTVLTPTGGAGVCVVTATKAASGNYAADSAVGNVTVTATPLPNPIPTLSEWAQLMMMLAMIATAGFYGWRMKQR